MVDPMEKIPELSDEEQLRLENLFKKIDKNGDGRIDVSDLTQSFTDMKFPKHPKHGYDQRAKTIIEQGDADQSGTLSFREFVKYIVEHERKLQLIFRDLDQNEDGQIDSKELVQAFLKMGVKIGEKEAKMLMAKIDKDKSLNVNWKEWRDFLLWHPKAELSDILHYWRHSTFIDIGEDSLVPDDYTENEMQTGMWWRNLVAGGTAGAVSRTTTAPLDRLKTVMQVIGSRKQISVVGGLQHMLREGGWKSLWRGNGMNVLKIAPESAIKFMSYEQIKRLIRGDSNRDIYIYERFMAGSAAGVVSQTSIYPMEVLKTRLTLGKTGQYSGIFDCARKISAKEGLSVFYRGYFPNIVGIIPYAGIDLCIYETLKRMYIKRHPDSEPSAFVLLACGTSSSTCGQLASYPLALIKTRLQAQETGKCDTMFTLSRSIFQNEGLKGFYRGLLPNFMKVAPAVSMSYVVYEYVRKWLQTS